MKKMAIVLFFISWLSFSYAQQVSTNIKTLLSSDGKVVYGNEPNSIVVIDYPENVQRVEEYLRMADVSPRQVLIEARVVEVKLQSEHSLGVNWQIFADKGYIPFGRFKAGGGGVLNTLPSSLTQTIPYKPTKYEPITGAAEEAPFTVTIFDDNISMVLKTLSNELDTDILSAPRITTVNNKEAAIKIIQSYPWAEPTETTNDSGIVTISWVIHFEEIGIMLKVTPTISDDNKILMYLDPEISEQNGQITLTTSTGLTYSVPKIDKRSASTKVVIGNGQTLIIGGLIKDKYIKGETKVPFFGDIPGLGYLFKSTKETKDKTELLIFVSPTIINPSELLSMQKSEEFGIGRRFISDRKKQKEQELERELIGKNQKNEAVIRLDLLSRKHKELIEKRKRLEKELMKEEVDLKTLKKTKNQAVVQTE